MEAFVVNRKSWHYRIAIQWRPRYGFTGYNDTFSVCEYWKTVVTAAVVFGLLAITVVGVASAYVFGMYVGLSYLLWGAEWPDGDMVLATAMALVTAIKLIAAATFFAKEKFKEYLLRRRWERGNSDSSYKPAGRLIQAYRHWKDRVCVPVEFND